MRPKHVKLYFWSLVTMSCALFVTLAANLSVKSKRTALNITLLIMFLAICGAVTTMLLAPHLRKRS